MLLLGALEYVQADPWQVVTLALADLGDIHLPDAQMPTRQVAVLASVSALYWVYGLDQAGLFRAADTVAGLWASGAIQVTLPDRGQGLQAYWQGRWHRLTAAEREQLMALVFDARDFEPAMRQLCTALVALADNAGQRDMREEVGLQHAAHRVLELCAARLEGAAELAAPDLIAQARTAVQLLSQRVLQTAFAVRDFYSLLELSDRAGAARMLTGSKARRWAERAQSGAAVLRWLASSAAQNFSVNPRAASLQNLMMDAQRWLMSGDAAAPGAGLA